MTLPSIEQALAQAHRHHQAGRFADAESLCRQILAQQPDHAESLHLLGFLEHRAGRSEAGLALIRRAIQIEPNRPDFYCNAGVLLAALRRHPKAIESQRRALAIQPNYAQALNELGNSLHRTGQLEEAKAALRRAIELRPNFFEAQINLGGVLSAAGDARGAIAAFGRARALRPDSLSALRNFVIACRDVGDLSQAADALRRSLPLDPKPVETLNNLGTLVKDLGRLDEAMDCFDRALKLDPENRTLQSNRLYILWFHPDFDGRRILREHQEWNRRHAQPLAAKILPHDNDRREDRRLRIGYVSPDFRRHPVGQALKPLFEQHHHDQFEIICFSNSNDSDEVTRRLRTSADGWHSIVGLSDTQAADLIRGQRIDILVDLSLHMAGNRLRMFAQKPAPVQVTYLGYPGTTGLETIDYRLSDPYLDPPGTDSFYSERTIRLPHTYICFKWTGDDRPVTPLPAAQAGHITFGSLNNFCKVTPAVLKTWAQILSAVKDSRLILRCPAGEAAERTSDIFAQNGIDPHRVELTQRSPWDQYLSLCQRQDIGLDPFPYPGHTTSFDSLWMGVPMVTLRGQTAVGRGGVSILNNLGLTELIADDPEQYIRIAVELAADLPRLTKLRGELRGRMLQSPLMNARQFAIDIETAYRQMWREWCRGT
jgi:predicted O-linked N-acetylglucosamine transferase (SPINDLY family)